MEKGHRIGIVNVKQVRFEDISSHVISCGYMIVKCYCTVQQYIFWLAADMCTDV